MSKIIKAVFTGRFCRTQRVFQFDTDDKLQIVNVNLPANYTVDFSNSKTGDSVPVLATSDTVQIPPDLFVPGSEIYAWIWVSDSNGGHTPCEATIPIDPRARRTGTEPTPAQASTWDEAVDTLNETIEGIPAVVDAALTEAKESGEFDGKDGADGSGVWYTTARVLAGSENPFVRRRDLIGREGATVQVNDLLFAPDVGYEGEPTTLYEITSVGIACALKRLCKMKGTDGEDGTSPGVTITEITGGHRITITDEAHPDGQSFDVMDGTGGGVTVDDALSGSSTNPVQNKVIKAALDGKGTYSKPASGIPKTDMAEDVQASLTKANTALQEVDAQDVLNLDQYIDSQDYVKRSWVQQQGYLTQHQDISGKLDKDFGVANANKVLTVNSSGVVVPEDNRIVVTFTPTSPDYSGTIDRSPAALAAAYDAGKRIIAYAPAYNFRCELSLATIKSGGLYTFDFIALGELNGQDIMLRLLTSDSASTYTAKVYPLATSQWTGGSY